MGNTAILLLEQGRNAALISTAVFGLCVLVKASCRKALRKQKR